MEKDKKGIEKKMDENQRSLAKIEADIGELKHRRIAMERSLDKMKAKPNEMKGN